MGSGSSLPVQSQAEGVDGISRAIHISAGSHHSCAAEETGYLQCWGGNDFGQLGTGGHASITTPVRITTAGLIEDVTAGGEHTCVLTRESQIMCWGRNRFGQLGSGSRSDIPVPAPVVWP
jgi:alpha-tubulin suppressor-like RCC1 family protein